MRSAARKSSSTHLVSTMRESLTTDQAWAHAVLDDVRNGEPALNRDVTRALRILGDLT